MVEKILMWTKQFSMANNNNNSSITVIDGDTNKEWYKINDLNWIRNMHLHCLVKKDWDPFLVCPHCGMAPDSESLYRYAGLDLQDIKNFSFHNFIALCKKDIRYNKSAREELEPRAYYFRANDTHWYNMYYYPPRFVI